MADMAKHTLSGRGGNENGSANILFCQTLTQTHQVY